MNKDQQLELHNALMDAIFAFGDKHGDTNLNAADFLGVLESVKFQLAESAFTMGKIKELKQATEGMFQ